MSHLLNRFLGKRKLEGDISNPVNLVNETGVDVLEKLRLVWTSIIDDTMRSIASHQITQSKRKRAREFQPYLIAAEGLKENQLNEASKIVSSVSVLLRSNNPEYIEVGKVMEEEFHDYRVSMRRAATTLYFDHLEHTSPGSTVRFFDSITWDTIFTNEVFTKYGVHIQHHLQYPLIYNLIMFLTLGVHPKDAAKQLRDAKQEDTSTQVFMKQEITQLHKLVQVHFNQVDVNGVNNEVQLKKLYELTHDVEPRVTQLIGSVKGVLNTLSRDPGYIPSHSHSVSFAKMGIAIIDGFRRDVMNKDRKNIINKATQYENEYMEGCTPTKRLHCTQSIDSYVAEWGVYKKDSVYKQMVESILDQFCQCLEESKKIRELVRPLQDPAIIDKVISELEGDVKALAEELLTITAAATDKKNMQKMLTTIATGNKTLVSLQNQAELECIARDAEEFSYNLGVMLTSMLDDQLSMEKTLDNQELKFQQVLDTPGVSSHGYNQKQEQLSSAMERKMKEVSLELKQMFHAVVTTLNTCHLPTLQTLLQQCHESAKRYRKQVRAPEEFVWIGITQVQTLRLSDSLQESVKKSLKPHCQRIETFGDTLEATPRVVLMSEMRQWVAVIRNILSNSCWTIEECFQLIDSVYKMMQLVQIDNNLLSPGS